MVFCHLKKIIFIGLLFISGVAFAQSKANIYTEDNQGITVTADKRTFIIKLKSNPTTGYSWFLREYHSAFLVPVHYKFESPADTKLMGAGGFELWTFRVKPNAFIVPQQTMIHFVYVRPWETPGRTQQIVFRVSTVRACSKS